jgi:hypothetical protein
MWLMESSSAAPHSNLELHLFYVKYHLSVYENNFYFNFNLNIFIKYLFK